MNEQRFEMEKFRGKRMNHQPADWLRDEPDYFITICADPRGVNHFCKPDVGPMILDSVNIGIKNKFGFATSLS